MKPLLKVRDELEKARLALEDMRKSHDLVSYEEAWKLFLMRLERVWNKLCAHLSKSPKYKNYLVIDHAKQLRANDPLLSYLTNARGVDEHTIEDITERQPRGIGISPATGNRLQIDHMTISNGNIVIKSKQPLRIDFFPEKIKLKSITNRSGTYHPPKTHLGNPIKSIEPMDVADAGLNYYKDLIEKAEEYFIK
jgi:hypothetical protein